MLDLLRTLWIYLVFTTLMCMVMLQVAEAQPLYLQVPTYATNQLLEGSEYYHIAVASRFINGDDCHQAVPHLQTAIDKSPGNLIAHYNLGNCYFDLARQANNKTEFTEHLNNAEKSLQRVQAMDPELMVTYFKLGKIALTQRQYDEALVIYQQGLKVEPNNAALYFNIAGVYDTQKKFDQAILHYQKAIEKDPQFVFAYNNMGLAYEITQQLDKAEAAYRNALALDPEYAFARLNLGNLRASQDDLTGAFHEYQKVIQQDPSNSWAHLYLGNVYFQQGESEKALQAYNHVQSINPGYPPVYYLKALVFQKLAKHREAIAAGLTYLTLSPRGEFAPEMTSLIRHLQAQEDQQAKAK